MMKENTPSKVLHIIIIVVKDIGVDKSSDPDVSEPSISDGNVLDGTVAVVIRTVLSA